MMWQSRVNRKILEFQNESISRHCDEVENIYQQMRGLRHDLNNCIQTIKACVAMGEMDKLREFCDRLDEDLKSIDTLIKTGNVMVDAILNSKLSLAKAKNIEIHAKATVPERIQITDVDLCVLLGNLLDNAIEACDRKAGSESFEFEGAFIRVYIGVKGSQLYICITNSAYVPAKRIGGKFISAKNSSAHGYGLLRIDRICEKYNGFIKRGSESGAFSTEILLPITQ